MAVPNLLQTTLSPFVLNNHIFGSEDKRNCDGIKRIKESKEWVKCPYSMKDKAAHASATLIPQI